MKQAEQECEDILTQKKRYLTRNLLVCEHSYMFICIIIVNQWFRLNYVQEAVNLTVHMSNTHILRERNMVEQIRGLY